MNYIQASNNYVNRPNPNIIQTPNNYRPVPNMIPNQNKSINMQNNINNNHNQQVFFQSQATLNNMPYGNYQQ